MNGTQDLFARAKDHTWPAVLVLPPQACVRVRRRPGVIDYRLRAQLDATIAVEDRIVEVSSGFDQQAWAPMLRGEYVRRLGDRWRMPASAPGPLVQRRQESSTGTRDQPPTGATSRSGGCAGSSAIDAVAASSACSAMRSSAVASRRPGQTWRPVP